MASGERSKEIDGSFFVPANETLRPLLLSFALHRSSGAGAHYYRRRLFSNYAVFLLEKTHSCQEDLLAGWVTRRGNHVLSLCES